MARSVDRYIEVLWIYGSVDWWIEDLWNGTSLYLWISRSVGC